MAVTIDVECDKGPGWEIQRPLQFASITYGIPRLLTPLFRKHGIRPTYLISPEVLANEECGEILRSLPNCELGTHLHGEFIPPEEDLSALRTHIPQLLYPPELEWQKLAKLTNQFEKRFGYRPRSFRAGRFGLSKYTLQFLAELGYEVDSSVTPFWTHEFESGTQCNYWGAPLQPYFPRWDKPGIAGNASILEVPVTIINPLLVYWPRWILRHMSSHTTWYKRFLRCLLGIEVPRTLWLRPQRSSVEEMLYVVDIVATRVPPKTPIVLNMMYHSVEVIPNASPYARNEAEVQAILHAQDSLFGALRERFDLRPVYLTELYHLWKYREA